ncbi:DUF1934 family protein [Alicyclobacillus sp.]|uniref:DUF1934 domain-containing protein n=1 Tax=Alicyclobacillus sp. TaxID=61169 RepID=UPI0025B7C72B|nr:DUF1934 family protein [Alicyclobacillus sp.]MCL6517622.1 DUF1934 family protein [Alicyclobacillus sp.]
MKVESGFWLADGDFRRPVTVHWVRRVVSVEDGSIDMERVSTSGVWVQRAGTHFLTYADPGAPPRSGDGPDARAAARADQTTLRLKPGEVVLARFGDIDWQHRFVPGRTTASAIRTAGVRLPLEVRTERLQMAVGRRGGALRCRYLMAMGGVTQDVRLLITWRDPVRRDARAPRGQSGDG